jgi:quinol monooxygenase YgiN
MKERPLVNDAISLPTPAPGEATPYSLFGLAKAKGGKGDALAARLLALVEPTRSEPGALQYHVHRDRDDPDLFAFYEAWETIDHLRAHLSTPAVAAFLRDRMDYLERDLEIRFVRMLSPHSWWTRAADHGPRAG